MKTGVTNKTAGALRLAMMILLVHGMGADAVSADLPNPVIDYRSVVKSADLATYSRAALALRKWMIANDPSRPLYHFTGPESWINDPGFFLAPRLGCIRAAASDRDQAVAATR